MEAIGIDLGTTSICGVSIDVETGALIKSRTISSNAFIKGEAFEKIQSPEKIIKIATEILEDLICDETKVIGVTGQMHGIVYTDKNGKAVSPLYTWQDGRGNLPYKNTTYAEYLGSFSGFGNVTDFYNRENGIRPKEAVSFCTIHDYLVMHLCSLTTPVIHVSDAASFGLFNLNENKFCCEFNAEVVNDCKICGSYKGIPVSIAIGDNQASVFSTLKNEDDLLLNIGTGSQVSVISDKIVCGENIETRPYFEGKYLIVGAALCGGRAYSVLKNFYRKTFGYIETLDDEKVYSIMNKMLENTEKTSLKVDTRFAGTRKKTNIKGSISGLTTENFSPEELTLGVLNGITAELYEMFTEIKTTKTGIVASGNGIRKNAALKAVVEDMFSSKIKTPLHLEEAAVGAALFALVSARIYKNAAEAQQLIKYE